MNSGRTELLATDREQGSQSLTEILSVASFPVGLESPSQKPSELLNSSILNSFQKGNPSVAEDTKDTSFVFLNNKLGYDLVWQKLSKLPVLSLGQMNLWVIAPGLRRRDYPQQLTIGSAKPTVGIANQIPCTRDPREYYRIGFPYQLYRCQKGASP